MSENKMVVSDKDTRIAPWGQRNEIREIARRVQLMAPGGKKLTENEALALAQGAVAHGLDPFNGEIWYIPGSGLMAGVKGLRKAARNQIDGNFWPEFEQISDPDERNSLLIPEGALAFRCILRDSETIAAYSKAWKDMAANGIPAEIIPNIIGKRPYVEGIGYLKKGESTRMDPVQVAMKRSEADALKRRFDLPFAIPSEPNGEVVEGEWTESVQEKPIEEKAEEAINTLFDEGRTGSGVEPPREQKDNRTLYDDEIDEYSEVPVQQSINRPYPPEVTRQRILEFSENEEFKGRRKDEKRGTIGLVQFIAWQMDECFPGPGAEGKRIAVLKYVFGETIESTNDLTGPQLCALEKWLDPAQREGPGAGKLPSKEARMEAVTMFAARLKEKGQQEMEV